MADLVHDFHALVFKCANTLATEEFFFEKNSWIMHNTFFGYAISMVSFLAILHILCKELTQVLTSKHPEACCMVDRGKKSVLSEFGASHGLIWSFSIILCSIIVFMGQNCDYLA